MDSTAVSASDPFSKYQIGESVGKGAFGKVYKALNTETGDFCAIKQIEKNIISEKQLPAILHEIKLLQTLQHVNIVRFIESHETPKYLFFALEFIEGGSLAKIAKRYGNFQEPLLSRYICQVLRGLEYLHEKGVIHRDIKSDNILITKEGVIKLADFGSCTYSALDRKLTVVGTPFWMAPEVIQMDMNARSTACDIWSLGCTILELLTGNPPYWDLGTMPAMFAMVNNPHPPFPAGISAELKNFLLACFVRDINKRPTATQLLEHPWIKMHMLNVDDPKKGHRVSVSGRHITASVSSSFDEDQQPVDDNDDENMASDLKERVVQLETQKKEMSQTIQKLKIHFIRAMREKKLMKEMIAQLVQERDQYMVKLGLTPPPPPSILNSNNNNSNGTVGRSINDSSTTDLLGVDSPSKHARSSSAPISPPMKIASSSPTPLTTAGTSQSSYKSTSNILASDFFQPSDSDSDGEDGGSDYLISSFGDLHAGVSRASAGPKRIPPKLSRESSDKPEFSSNPSLGGYFSTNNNLHAYHQSTGMVSAHPSDNNVNLNVYASSPTQYSVGGALNIGSGHNSLGSNNGILINGQPQALGGGGSLKSNSFNSSLGNANNNNNNNNNGANKMPPSLLKRESSQKSSLTQYLPSKERRDSIGGKDSLSGANGIGLAGGMMAAGSGSGSIGPSGSAPRKSSQPMPLNQSSDRSILSSSSSTDEGENQQSVPPVESVVVNVQPPRVGDECKVKCGDGWYDAIVELVSGTTFVVTIKPFNIKQEVSHSDVTLAPLQFPVNTKKKSKFSLFGKSGKS